MENLYFLAITPPESVSQKIINIQEDIASRFQSRASLKVMPHITLKAPFRFPVAAHENILQWFGGLTVHVSPFLLELNGFDAFHNKNKPVIFIDPEFSPELISLQKQIISSFRESFPEELIMNTELNYHPHLTVAFRDLQPVLFREAWEEFKDKEFSESFEVSHYHLLQLREKCWQIIHSNEIFRE